MRMIQVAKSNEASLKVGKKSKNIKNSPHGPAVKGRSEIAAPKGKVSFKNSLAINLKKLEKRESLKDSKLNLLTTKKKTKSSKVDNLKQKESKKAELNKLNKGEDQDINIQGQIASFNEVKKIDSDIQIANKESSSEGEISSNDGKKLTLATEVLNKTPQEPGKVKKKNSVNEVEKRTEKSQKDKKVSVKDLRSNKPNEASEVVSQEGSKVINQNPDNMEFESSTEKTIVLGTTEISAEGEGGKAQAPVMKEAATQLKQHLKEFGNNEIVKNTRFILKDNNVGEIKLILKPESLGEVKINLNLNDNNLAGQIVVENSAVKEVFQENMSSLTKALESKGFDSANIDLSLSDKGEGRERRQGENKQYFSDRLKKFEDSGRVVRYGLPTAGINLTA